jgi:hypothetical protein
MQAAAVPYLSQAGEGILTPRVRDVDPRMISRRRCYRMSMSQAKKVTTMEAELTQDANAGIYRITFKDGWSVTIDRTVEYSEQINVRVYAPGRSIRTDSTTWAR